jgi:uncharacterized protein (TIGR01319 family)
MTIDCLVAEIGSTTTIVNAFDLSKPAFLGRGMARTSVETDVREGLSKAIENLRLNLGADRLSYRMMIASSSAAGGLRMTVHGLVKEMTVKAAEQAALNAGANLHLVTAGPLDDHDMAKIRSVRPNIIVVAGGTDHGEKTIPFDNLVKVAALGIPVIYAGNVANHDRIRALSFDHVTIVENVYPRVDDVNILPLRKAIYDTFEHHIVHAPGMAHVFDMVDKVIIPTPGAVMDATALYDSIEPGVVTLDVGGATTDVHSVCDPRPEFQRDMEGEPRAKRTVEGDLGVYVNRMRVLETMSLRQIESMTGLSFEEARVLAQKEPFIPETEDGLRLVRALAGTCVKGALDRHAGDMRRVFTTNGIKVIPEGRDLSMVRTVILTGGALLHHPNAEDVIRDHVLSSPTRLLFDSGVRILRDRHYIMASLGVLSAVDREAAIRLLQDTLRMEDL